MSRWRSLGAFGGYFLLACAITWPVILRPAAGFIGLAESDAYEYARHIWWFGYALRNGEPLIFQQPLLGYPGGLDGGLLWAIPLQSFPAWVLALVMPLPVAYNLSFLLVIALNGWAVHWLVMRLTDTRPAALLAGVIFAAYPAFQGQMLGSHVGLLTLWPAPLYAGLLLRLQEPARPVHYLLVAITFTLSLLGSSVLLIFVLFPLTVCFMIARLVGGQWVWLRRSIIGVVLGGVLSAVFLVPALLAPTSPDIGGDIRFSADLLAFASPSFYHPLFAWMTYPRRVLGTNVVEGFGYVGILAGILALVGIITAPKARFWWGTGLLAWFFSLGPLLKIFDEPLTLNLDGHATHATMPWTLIFALPPFSVTRTPARFNFMVGLAVAVMAGYGVAWLWGRFGGRWRYGVVSVLALAIAFEYHVPWENGLPHMPMTPAFAPAEIAELRDDDTVRAVMNLPWHHLLAAKDGMYLQSVHHKPLIAGHVARQTPVDAAKLALLQQTLSPALLDEAGVDVLILHKLWAAEDLEPRLRDTLGAPFYDDDRLAVWRASRADDASPAFAVQVTSAEALRTTTDSYLYAPERGFALFSAQLEAAGRTPVLNLDGRQVHGWSLDGEISARVPLLIEPGYHTATLSLRPRCPVAPSTALVCLEVDLIDTAVDSFTRVQAGPVAFGEGITLEGAHLSPGDDVRVWLSWRFEEPLPDTFIRFVHLLDAEGNLAAQSDVPLPDVEGWAEEVVLTPPEGEFTVFTGWYTLPDVARVLVLDEVPGSVNNWVQLGQ